MDYIKISGYKSIYKEKINLKPINILIGANGSGKSNFISFFDFLRKLYNRNLNEYIALTGGENKVLHKGKKVTDRISFKMEFKKGKNSYAAKLQLGTGGFIFTDERLMDKRVLLPLFADERLIDKRVLLPFADERLNDRGVNISHSNSESNLRTTDHYMAKHIIRCLQGFRKYHFHDTSTRSLFTSLSHIENDINYLYGNGSNLAAFLYDIKKQNPITYRHIVHTIQSVAPYFLDFELIPNEGSFVRLLWKDKYSDMVYGITDLSDGTIRFIALTVLFLQPKLPDTIIIDEPELGLHPTAIAKLSGMIRSVAKKNCQVIIATQSPDLISHFSPDNIITVDQIDGCSKFKRLNADDLKEWLEDYTIDDLWKRNIIPSGQPNF